MDLTVGEINLDRGRYAEAVASFQRLLDAAPNAPAPRAFLAFTYARAGDSTRATLQLNDLLTRWRTGRSNALYVAIAYAGLRDYDNAFAWLDRAYQDRSLRPLLMAPTFRELHKDPRFGALMRRIGLRT
jgi:tetratricopeptide (TPR) repeat protein